jgi:biopolymer transport protein ExbD
MVMRKRFTPGHSTHTEFELDLAPLLAVMVKLVPVLLISSAFVQIMIIESDLPQAVKQQIEENNKNEPQITVSLEAGSDGSLKLITQKDSQQTLVEIPAKNNSFDLERLQLEFQTVKKQYPEIFRLDLKPDSKVPYKDIVKLMDEARRSRNKELKFPVIDKTDNREIMTEYMFPDVVFANVMEG